MSDTLADVATKVREATGQEVTHLDVFTAAGSFVPNRHYKATLGNGANVFVKEAADAWTLGLIGAERVAYTAIGAQRYLPSYFGGDANVLVVEDLNAGHWPPPWRDGDLGRVFVALADIAGTSVPTALRDLNGDGMLHCWSRVAEAPDAFLSLGLCTKKRFESTIDVLAGSDKTSLAGDALVHGDFRGDNLCLLDDRVVVVDWPGAARGRSDFDRTAFALSYAVETGERPELVAPDADADLVAVLAGPLARFAGDTTVPARVRTQLTGQLRVALPWWARLSGRVAS